MFKEQAPIVFPRGASGYHRSKARGNGPRLCAEHQPQRHGDRPVRDDFNTRGHPHALRLVLRTQPRSGGGSMRPFPRRAFILLLSFELCFWNFAMRAAAPTLDHLYPVAVQIGFTNVVTAIGKFDPWPPKVWVDAPGIVFHAETNAGKFAVEIATNTPAGPHLIRVFNEQGASGPRFLIVTGEPQVAEQEP